MKRIGLLLLFAVFMLTACNNKKILLDEERTFANDVWNRFTPEVFEVNIDNPDDYYHVTFEVEVDTALMRGDGFPMLVKLYSPGGERRTFRSGLTLRQNGRWKGENSGAYRLVGDRVKAFFSFNAKGTHRMEVSQATSQYDMEGVHMLRVVVERAKLDYPE